MKGKSILFTVAMFLFLCVPSLAFYPSGTINNDITYDYIKLLPQRYSIRVSGVLYNKTSQPIKFDGVIKFVTIHEEILNSATI